MATGDAHADRAQGHAGDGGVRTQRTRLRQRIPVAAGRLPQHVLGLISHRTRPPQPVARVRNQPGNTQPHAAVGGRLLILHVGDDRPGGVVVPDITNPYFGELVEQFEHVATEYGHSLVVNLSHGLADIERTRVEELSDRDVDAIFLSPAQTNAELGALIRQGKRIVVLDHTATIPGMKTVSTDFMQASHAITTHLLEHGRRRTVMLFGDEAALSDQRVMGWIQAHRDLGLPAGPIRQSDFTREGTYQIMAELLALPANERPDAVFAASDLEALGALRAIHEAGLRIPDDIAIISFDGTAETLYTWPQLTTTKQDTAQIARCAIDAALNPDSAPDVQLVPAELIIRQSCGCR